MGENAPKTLEEFQKLKYTNNEEWDKTKSKAQEELPKMDFEEMKPFMGTLSNKQARLWYKYHDKNIPNVIDKTKPLLEQAKEACELRNKYRTQTRDLMKDQEERKRLDINYPNKPFEFYYNKYSKPMNDGTIPSEDDVCRMIINKSTTSNKAFDKKVGINDD